MGLKSQLSHTVLGLNPHHTQGLWDPQSGMIILLRRGLKMKPKQFSTHLVGLSKTKQASSHCRLLWGHCFRWKVCRCQDLQHVWWSNSTPRQRQDLCMVRPPRTLTTPASSIQLRTPLGSAQLCSYPHHLLLPSSQEPHLIPPFLLPVSLQWLLPISPLAQYQSCYSTASSGQNHTPKFPPDWD